jgi:hypothetical protein
MYRDDFEAALERAADLERELERAHAEHARDEQKIADLRAKLEAAQREIKEAKQKRKRDDDPPKPDRADWKEGLSDDRTPVDQRRTAEMLERMENDRKAKSDSAAPADDKPATYRTRLLVAGTGIGIAAAGLIAYATLRPTAPSTPTPATTPAGVTPAPTGAPVKSNRDPTTYVDVSGNLPQAYALARGTFSDGELTEIDAEYVDDQGIANLNYNGEVRYYFMSPSRAAAADPKATEPVGAPHNQQRPFCTLDVKIYPERKPYVREGSNGEHDCGSPVAPPRCTVAEVWGLAKSRGAPSPALAHIKYGSKGWSFKISDSGKTLFREMIADSCAAK